MTTSRRFAPPATRQETDETQVVRYTVIAIGRALLGVYCAEVFSAFCHH